MEFKEELIEYLEQGFLNSEIYFFIPHVGWIYFDTTDPIQQEAEYSPFFEQTIIPYLLELEPSLKE